MRPNVQDTRDPLNAALLPPSVDAMELNFRTTTDVEAVPKPLALCGLAVALTFLMAVGRPLLACQTAMIQHTCYAVIGLGMVWQAAERWRKGLRFEPILCMAALLAMPSFTTAPLAPIATFLAFLCAFGMAIHFALEIAHHAAAWHSAEMRVPIPIRRRFLAVWRVGSLWRAFREPTGETPSPVRTAESGERESLRSTLQFIAALAIGALLLVVVAPVPLWAGCLATMALTVAILGLALVNLTAIGILRGRRWQQVIGDIHLGWVLWFGYNPLASEAPGLFRSPAGTATERRRRFEIVFVSFVVTQVVAAAYFPLAMMATDPALWRYPPFEPNITNRRTITHERPIPAESQTYLNHLPPSERDAYARTLQARFTDTETTATVREPMVNRITPNPWTRSEGWLVYSWLRLFDEPGRWLPLTLILWGLMPTLLFFALLLAVAGRPLVHCAASFESNSPYRRPLELWQATVTRIRTSRNPLERDHFWIGVAEATNTPVMLHRKLVSEHAHLLGSTGSNKTSVGLIQMIEQLVGPETIVAVLDLKGDMALFEAARLAAANAHDERGNATPLPFRWFTTESGFSSYVFNPFMQTAIRNLSRLERTEVYAKALGLEHGDGYGRGHFSLQNRNALLKLISACPEVESFRQLHEEARRQRRLFTGWEREHASDFFSVVHTLANIDALNVAPRDRFDRRILDNAIEMADVVGRPQVLYFRLPAASQSASIRDVGKLIIHSLLTAAFRHTGERRQIYLFIDEFQQLVSVDLAVVLQQARSMGLGVIMAHQTQSDLELPERNMMQVVEDNTHFKQIFSVNDLGHREALSKLSGEARYHAAQWKQGIEAFEDDIFEPSAGLVATYPPDTGGILEDPEITVREEIGVRLRPNDLAAMSARQDLCMVHFKRNIGYVQYDGLPFIARTAYHVSEAEYARRSRAPWPAANAETITAPLQPDQFFFKVSVESPSRSAQLTLPFPVSARMNDPDEPDGEEPEAEGVETKSTGTGATPMTASNDITSALDAE